MPLSLLTKLKLLEFKVTMMDLKLFLVLLSMEEIAQLLHKPTVAHAIPAHANLRKSIADTMLLMLLEKLSRKLPRISKEKLRRERTKRKPKLESRRLKRKPKDLKLNKNPLMRPRKSSTPSRKPSANKRRSTPRKSKIKLSRKLENKPKKKFLKLLTILTKLSKLKPSEMPLIKPPLKSKKVPKNPRRMPPPPKLLLIRPPLMPRPLEIRSLIPLKPPVKKPMPLPNLLKKKLMVPRRKPKKLKQKLPQRKHE